MTLIIALLSSTAFATGCYLTRKSATINQHRNGLRLFILAFALDGVLLTEHIWREDYVSAGVIGGVMLLLVAIFTLDFVHFMKLRREAGI